MSGDVAAVVMTLTSTLRCGHLVGQNIINVDLRLEEYKIGETPTNKDRRAGGTSHNDHKILRG